MAPAYTKKLICLANSWKIKGRCIACKEFGPPLGAWVRPVSSRPSGELDRNEYVYENGSHVEVGDIFMMSFQRPAQHPFQVENHVVDAGYYCTFLKKADPATFRACLDPNTALPWPMGHSTRYGDNDQVPEALAPNAKESLRLIEVSDFMVKVEHEWPDYGNKRKVRGSFTRHGRKYKFGITDPNILSRFAATPDGEYPVGACILCISLGEALKGFAYKLIATVII